MSPRWRPRTPEELRSSLVQVVVLCVVMVIFSLVAVSGGFVALGLVLLFLTLAVLFFGVYRLWQIRGRSGKSNS